MRKLGIIRNLKNGAKDKTKKIAKGIATKGAVHLLTLLAPAIPYILLAILGTAIVSAIIDFVVELFTAENNPQLIYEDFEIENVAELVEIKEDGNGGYYLDFVDGVDDKLEEIIDKANKGGEYHNLPNEINFLKKMLKAEVYTQFPDLGGTVPSNSKDGFQGAVQIRRVTPNKDVGEMKNTGKGETSNLEQGTVNEPVSVEDRNDQNKIDSWQSGQKLKIIAVETLLYQDQYDAGYWEPIMVEGSTTQEVKLQKDEVVTYQGEYEIYNNALTGQQIIYLKIKTDDGLEGYLRSSTVNAVLDENEQGQVINQENNKTRLATTSRAQASREEIGVEGEEYVVAIAAGRNNGDDTGIVNEEKGLVEEDLTIEVAERVEELLNNYSNIRVVQTGSTSDNRDGVEPEDRAELTRDANPDLCIQIYFGDGNEVGVETIFKNGDEISHQLADILAENIASSMGLTNLLAGADVEKCMDSDGQASSLNIIDNTAVAGFPSVVTIGGNLNKDPDASVIADGGVEKYAQGIVNGIDEYFKADHTGRVATEVGEVTYTSSIESKIINMKYVSQETMQGYVDDGNIEEAMKCYTLDDDGNVVIASWSQNEDGSIEIKTNNSMNLKTALEKYVMPYEYLLYYYIDTDYRDFVDDLADEVMNSEIVVAVQDEITTTHTVETTEQMTEATLDQFDVEWHETNSRDFVTEGVSTKVNLTYVSTWCVKSYQENSYSEEVLNLGDEEEKIVEVPGKVSHTPPTPSTVENVIVDNAQGRYNHQQIDEHGEVVRDEDGNIVYETEYYVYDILEHITTETESYSNTYEKGEYKTEGRENVFVKLYNEHDMISKVRTSDYLFGIIENNERTANLLDLTKYLIYKATNTPYGVLKFDFEEYDLSSFTQMSGFYGGSTEEKVWWALIDAGYSKEATAGALGNIWKESGFQYDVVEYGYNESNGGIGLCQWTNSNRGSSGRNQQLKDYAASKGKEWTDLPTQIEFLLAELTPGGNGYADYQLMNNKGYTTESWKNASTPEEASSAFMWTFERPASNSTEAERAKKAREYYEQFKDAEKPTGDDRIGEINLSGENANKMMQMLTEAIRIAEDDRYTYSQANRYGEFQYDCSSLISRLYKQYFDFNAPSTTYGYGSAYLVGSDGSVELQPGDILWRAEHVEMYIGNGLRVGAHSARLPTPDQISIKNYNPGYFVRVYRFITD